MLSKVAVVAAAGIAAVSANCVSPSQFPFNPVTAPDSVTFPTIGAAFDVTWDATGMSDSVTLVLLKGCPSNCQVVGDIATSISNTGSFSWVPDCSLEVDITLESYGIEMIDDNLCMFQWSSHFGLHADISGVCNPATSTTTTAASTTTTATSTPATATTTTTSTPSSAKSMSMSTSYSAPPMPTGGSGPMGGMGGSGGYGNGTRPTGPSGPAPSGTYKPKTGDAGSFAVSTLGGILAVFGAVLMI